MPPVLPITPLAIHYLTYADEIMIGKFVSNCWISRFAIRMLVEDGNFVEPTWMITMDFVMIYCLDLMRVVHALNISYRRSIQSDIEIIKYRAWYKDRQGLIAFIIHHDTTTTRFCPRRHVSNIK